MSAANTKAQELAIRQSGNVLVVAGAGTGKTRTLVQRCLRLLIETRCGLDRILMVTFTDAAAAEMRRRIRDELRKLQRSEIDPALAEYIRNQLLLLDAAHIGTLHSFCLQVVRRHTHQLEIDPHVVVLDEPQTAPLRTQVLDALLSRYYGDEKGGLDKVCDEVGGEGEMHQLLRQIGGGIDARVRSLLLRIHRHCQSLADPDEWLLEQERIYLATEPVAWRQWLETAFAEWRAEWLPDLRNAECGTGEEARIATDIGVFATASHAEEALNALGGLGEIRAFKHRKFDRFWSDAEFLLGVYKDPGGVLLEEWNNARRVVLALMQLTREFNQAYAAAKRQMGGLDFSDLEQHALRLLRSGRAGGNSPVGSEGGISAVARQWRNRFDFIFVDECQDINRAQDAIIRAISRGGDAANRFLVGDVKQSIFRFRRADPSIFTEYHGKWGRNEGGAQIPLSDNFRSREGILSFVNTLFSALMRRSIGGVEYGADAHLQFGNSGARQQLAATVNSQPRVELHVIETPADAEVVAARSSDSQEVNGDGDDDESGEDGFPDLTKTEREARLAAALLRQLHDTGHLIWDEEEERMRPVQWRDMAVLLRSAANRVESYAKEFSKTGVPLIAARTGFFETFEVSDLLSLLRILDNPLQDLPLLAVLRSPFAAFSLEDLAAMRVCSPEGNLWKALNTFHRGKESGRETQSPHVDTAQGWSKADRFLDQYARWRALARQSSVADCLRAILAETHYEAMLLAEPRGEERVANVHRLLEMARHYDPYQRQGLYRFLQFVDAQQKEEVDHEPASSQSENAVRLMTIHKSKGLEFPIVLLSGLSTGFNFRDLTGDVLIQDRYGICPKIWPPGAVQNYPGLAHWMATRAEKRELLGEEMRLLYVGVTRARDTLLLTGTLRKGASLRGARARPLDKVDDKVQGAVTDRELVSARCYLDWLIKWLPSVIAATDWKQEREGQNALLRWRSYPLNDPFLRCVTVPDENKPATIESRQSERQNSEETGSLTDAHRRLSWKYPHIAATREPAVKRVSEVIWAPVDDSEEDQLVLDYSVSNPEGFRQNDPPGGFTAGRRARRLTAAEVGVAYHTYLQTVPLADSLSLAHLQAHAQRLLADRALKAEEVAAIDLKAIEAFFVSAVGRSILSHWKAVHREVPFTARFSAQDLALVGIAANTNELEGEFFVARGAVDLAVLLPEEIWVVDFKTDRAEPDNLGEKVVVYGRQVRLYGLALGRIYRRPVTKSWLHFLSTGTTVEV